jgi:hypothetical protein
LAENSIRDDCTPFSKRPSHDSEDLILSLAGEDILDHFIERVGLRIATQNLVQYGVDHRVSKKEEVVSKRVVVAGFSFVAFDPEGFKFFLPPVYIKAKTLVKKFPDEADMVFFKRVHSSKKETEF